MASGAERPAGEVHRLVEARGGVGEGRVGPQRVDDLLPVQPPIRRQRQKLDEVGRRTATPMRRVDHHTVDANCEAAEECDLVSGRGHEPVLPPESERPRSTTT